MKYTFITFTLRFTQAGVVVSVKIPSMGQIDMLIIIHIQVERVQKRSLKKHHHKLNINMKYNECDSPTFLY